VRNMGGAFGNSVGTPMNIACTPGIGAVAANLSYAFNAQTIIEIGVLGYPADKRSQAAVEPPIDRGQARLGRPMANFRYRTHVSQLSRDNKGRMVHDISKVVGGDYLDMKKFVLGNLKNLGSAHANTFRACVPLSIRKPTLKTSNMI
jgi:hypothetical protein